jgi:cell division protein FtsI (penicillin-binding protein 3)
VGVDHEGLSGVEHQYENVLKGKPGRLVAERDQQGREIPGGRIEYDPSARGDDLVLTLDRSLQYEAERRLAAQIVSTNAKGGMALVMDTRSGELLAMANLVVDPDSGSVMQADRNAAVTNVYEPGSVAKLVTVAGAIEDGVVDADAVLQVPGSIRIADHTFTEHDPHPTQSWSVTDIVANSSNVGTIMIAKKLGKDRFDQALRAFGFGSKTGLGAPGESAGILMDPSDYTGTSMGSFPIGQGIATTPVQMLAAYNTVANGGSYVAPKLVKATVGPDGTQHATDAAPAHRVVSSQTAAELTRMLTEVVRVGTGTLAAVDGYTVAGKTGTARKPLVGKRGYEDGAYVSSFAGFVPAEDPQISGLVVLDQPTPIYGGLVAAPVFADLARYTLRELRIPPPSIALPATKAKAATPATAKGVGDAGDASAPTTVPNAPSTATPPAPAVDPVAATTTTAAPKPSPRPSAKPSTSTTKPSPTTTTAKRSTTSTTSGPPAGRRPGGTVSGR